MAATGNNGTGAWKVTLRLFACLQNSTASKKTKSSACVVSSASFLPVLVVPAVPVLHVACQFQTLIHCLIVAFFFVMVQPCIVKKVKSSSIFSAPAVCQAVGLVARMKYKNVCACRVGCTFKGMLTQNFGLVFFCCNMLLGGLLA